MAKKGTGNVVRVKQLIHKPKKICVLASGGDAPGMNACIEALFNYATKLGHEVYISIMGFDGLVNNNIVRATFDKCNNISHIAGCVYKCGRSAEFTSNNGFNRALDTIRAFQFDCIVVIGGNGSFMGLERLKKSGIRVIGIPATIDNDLYYTRNALGFSSACEAIVQLVDMLRATMQTNERNHIVQLMGRDCNALALRAGIASFANIVDINERRHSAKQIAEIFKQQQERGNESVMMIMQERKGANVTQEAIDSANFVDEIMKIAGDKKIRMNTFGHLQRGATPSCHDRFLGANYGTIAVDLIESKKYGVAIGLINDSFRIMDIELAIKVGPSFNEAKYLLADKIANR